LYHISKHFDKLCNKNSAFLTYVSKTAYSKEQNWPKAKITGRLQFKNQEETSQLLIYMSVR